MAEGVLFNIAGGIIKSLAPMVAPLAAEEIGLLWNFQNDLEDLEITVSTIKDVLLDAEQKQAGSHAVRGWLRRLNDLLYEADDFLDAISINARRREIMTRNKKAKEVRIFFSKSNQLVYVHRMGRKIKEIRERFDGIAANIKNFEFLVRPVEAPRDWKRNDTHSHLGEEIVSGREDDKSAVIDRLMESNVEGNVSIVPIVGFGGLGKTTLAQQIFNDKKIQEYFELKMWVCVSDNFDVKDIIKKILEVAPKDLETSMDNLPKEIQGRKNPETTVMETLVRDLLKAFEGKKGPSDVMQKLVPDLLKAIKGKKYLLVLDDVWEDGNELLSLKSLLMGGAKGSRILITTRKESVARTLQAKPYPLGCLDGLASWELFKQVAFDNDKMSESFEEMGKEILKKCGGVPLAIKTVGRLLRCKGSEIWQEFIRKELSKIPQEVNDILPTLKLSYDELPSHLKHCFAYCSLFPKDYDFDKATLVNLWIAQGYVESEGNQCLEDIGNEYFMNLFWRSFFQEIRKDKFGNIIGCKMHDLMHDLAILVAEPLVITFSSFKKSINYKRTRHIAISYDISSSAKLSPLYKASRIRTFLCPVVDDSYSHSKIDCEAILQSFKFLRVLDLSRRKLKGVPSSISKLKHLRYLDLSKNKKIKKLPSSIIMLVNLQNLCLSGCYGLIKLPRFGQLVNLRHFDVSFCKRLRSLPRDIFRLVNLRHLNIQGCSQFKYLPSGISQLTNLQLLTDFVVSSGSFSRASSGLAELNGLNKLRGNLAIRGLRCGKGVLTEYEATNLMGKENLKSLCLEWSKEGIVNDFDDDVSMEGLQPHQNLKHLTLRSYWCLRRPSWLSLLTNLVSLSLNDCNKWQDLTPLNHLFSLESLELRGMKDMEYISNLGERSEFSLSSLAQMTFFPALKEMTLADCPNLKGWWGGSSTEDDNLLLSFPLLSKLEIRDCPMLTSMPMFPHLEEPLLLGNTSWKPLQQTLTMNTTAATASSKLAVSLDTPLSKLKEIVFHSITDLEALPEEGLQNLTSLEKLTFEDCDKLKSLSPGVQYLTTVQKLNIWWCSMFVEYEDEMQWQGLKSLSHLIFWDLPKLSFLPSGLQHVTTLKKIEIYECRSLTTIAEWIHQCKSLEELAIAGCPNLVSLPVGTCDRWSIQKLSIWGCPILSQKCEREKGEYWPHIAHIPQLDVDPPESKSALQRMFRKIRSLGC